MTVEIYDGAIQAPSPNHSGKIDPKFIVMHYTAGWTAESAVSTFASSNSRVSAQITIDTDGTVYQHVPFNVKAWHAGPSKYMGYSGLNAHSIGIELVNPGFLRASGTGYTDKRGNKYSRDQVGPVVAAKYPRAGSGTFYWPIYPKAQLDAAKAVIAHVTENYGILAVVGHEEIDTRGWKTDPGPAFPMSDFKKLINNRDVDRDMYEVTATALNVRGGPGTNFAVIQKATKGTRVEVGETFGDWARISSDGWVHVAFIRPI